MERRFTNSLSKDEYLNWEWTDITLKDKDGKEIFNKKCQFPKEWSYNAKVITASKYFTNQENSLKQLIGRVVHTITEAGRKQKIFNLTKEEDICFFDELNHILTNQLAAFNSPVFFNCGVDGRARQASACFLLDVEDNMNSILDWVKSEAIIFKGGSGSGVNVSKLRAKNEPIHPRGTSSGPLSFMAAADSMAGVIKSGSVCLAPWQYIYTDQGPIKVEDLAKKDKFIVISYDPPSKRYKAKWATACNVGQKSILKITTDKGEFYLTEEHALKLSTGESCKAKNLQPGMSLFSCSINNDHGYQSIGLHDGKKGKIRFNRLIAQDILNKSILDKHVHHIDENKLNNSLQNLEVLTNSEHVKYHSDIKVSNNIHIFQHVKFNRVGINNGMHSSNSFWDNKEKVNSYKNKQKQILIESNRSQPMQQLAAEQKLLNTAFKILNSGGKIDTFENYIQGRKTYIGRISSIKQVKQNILTRFNTYDNFIKAVSENNHRVTKIEYFKTDYVYDIEVQCHTEDDKTINSGHNFVIWPNNNYFGSGIAVFNSRRAAKMVIMDADHPDIEEFIACKQTAEEVLRKFKEVNGEIDVNSDILNFIPYQNANNSVSVTDKFMEAVKNDENWVLKARTPTGKSKTVKAKELFHKIAETAWNCADPGLFYYDNINKWHTVPNDGPIITTNPCGEYLFLKNSACNLSSINLLKFFTFENNKNQFKIDDFIHTVKIMITAMEILVSYSEYPLPEITKNSEKYRTLGLGYANLGASLMSLGLPYDSESSRIIAASITSLMTATAYHKSSEIAQKVGSFDGLKNNYIEFKNVITEHLIHHEKLEEKNIGFIPLSNLESIIGNAGQYWNTLQECKYFRNAQISLLAPTGTISFMMDCDTTGVEPEMSLIKYKTLVGGGNLKIVNHNVEQALYSLKTYTQHEIGIILKYIQDNNTVEGAPVLKKEHYPVFDCAFGEHSIAPMGHVAMVASIVPFLSGSISKTINLPNDCTVEDIENVYMQAWEMGIKDISVYRDGSKVAQPVKTSDKKVATHDEVKDIYSEGLKVGMELNLSFAPQRKRLPDTRQSVTHKFSIAGHEGYLTVGLYPDGKPGEIFITVSKEGSTISGLMDAFATSISTGLQYGVHLESLIEKFKHCRFEPAGFTTNPDIPQVTSILDYIFKWLEKEFKTTKEIQFHTKEFMDHLDSQAKVVKPVENQTNGDICFNCGSLMIQAGACKSCPACGESTGCG